jgi:hypothetical protein
VWYIVSIALAAVIVTIKIWLAVRGKGAGDFFKVAIPRTLDKPLAMGTRLDIAAALKKHGTQVDELRPLLDGAHDQELLDRYWNALEPPQGH